MNHLDIEQEIRKIVLAMRSRSSFLGQALITHLRTQLSVEELAGIMIVCIERLLYWADTETVGWSLHHLIPADINQEIKRITAVAVFQRLIAQGLIPGQDFSMDAQGNIMFNDKAKSLLLGC
jgi:hypothetical protein